MKSILIKIAAGSFLFLSLSVVAGFTIQGTQLLDGNGQNFIMRGINYPYTWWSYRLNQSVTGIAASGANTIRVTLSTGQQWSRNSGWEIENILRLAKENNLILVVQVHDSTGWPEKPDAAPLSTSVDYWLSDDIKAALQGEEDYVILNIANEAIGNTTDGNFYKNEYTTAIRRLREGGYTHTIMIDGGNWGQDWQYPMRDNAEAIFESDSLKNTLFSIHMYEVFPNESAVKSYLQAFKDMNLPLVIGEFGPDHFGKPVDEDAIMAQAQAFGIGHIGWAWKGNTYELRSLDMTNDWDINSLTTWGDRYINGKDGIRQTSKIASIFLDINVDDLAFGKPVTISSSDGFASDGSAAVDGSSGTRWASEWSDPQWIVVDLQSRYHINRVKLNWEAAYASRYKIQVSEDASSWNDVIEINDGNGLVDDLNLSAQSNRTGRYVRMLGLERATQWGYSLWDFEVYGDAATTNPDPDPTPTISLISENKPAQISSSDGFAGGAEAVVDGNAQTRWASEWSDPQWVSIDLQAIYDISRVKLNWETAYGQSYEIQVSSDGSNWTTIYSTTAGSGGVEDINVTGTGQYIRMYGTSRATQWGYSLWEFEVYGSVSP